MQEELQTIPSSQRRIDELLSELEAEYGEHGGEFIAAISVANGNVLFDFNPDLEKDEMAIIVDEAGPALDRAARKIIELQCQRGGRA